jgi:hypothetical protein
MRPLVTARAEADNAATATNFAPQQTAIPGPAVPAKLDRDDPVPLSGSGPSRWAALLARIYEVFPLICPSCQTPLTFIAFLTDPLPITKILAHIGQPTSPPPLHPARGPPQTEFLVDLGGPSPEDVAQECLPDDFDQSPAFDPAGPESVPEEDFDQSLDW